jgi:pantoate--beta-alanine ligase
LTPDDSLRQEISNNARVITDGEALRKAIHQERRKGRRIGLVPTMGALHEGHLSLVRAARKECDCVVVSIFVNPTQFGPQEDFRKYPRTLESDLEALAGADVRWVFVPSATQMYPEGFSTYVQPPKVASPWEGECRSGHFRGVVTVVLKLFLLAPADVAFFGQKDFQQLLVIQHMARDLNVSVDIRRCPIVREPDGLAMSSRNRYLNNVERQRALGLFHALQTVEQQVADGVRDTRGMVEAMQKTLTDAEISRIDYVTIADAETLEPIQRLDREAVALIAAFVGKTRLIDNCLLNV